MASSPARLAVALLLAICALDSSTAQNSGVSPSRDTDLVNKPHRTVCVAPYTALAECGTDNTTDFTGYEPELFKEVANWLWNGGGRPEWAPGNWSFICFVDTTTGYYDMILALNNGTCDVGMGGITQDEVAELPVVLTYSTYQAGRRIMIKRNDPEALWVFMQPFETGVWLLLFASPVVVALVLVVLEAPWAQLLHSEDGLLHWQGRHWKTVLSELWQRYSNIQWSVLGMVLHGVFQVSPRTPGGRVVVLGTAFMATLLLCMYTSAYAALITTTNLKAQIASMSDLTTLPVGIWEGDEDSFKVFPLQNVKPLPWNTYEDEQAMIALLREGVVSALVVDAPFADYQTSINCDLQEVGELVLPINMGFMFARSLAQSYAINFDSALQFLQGQGVLQRLQLQYIRIQSDCPDRQQGKLYTQIRLVDVGGLWIILASCIGLGLLWNMAVWAAPFCQARLAGARGCGWCADSGEGDSDTVIKLPGSQAAMDRGAPQPVTIDEALVGVSRRLDKLDGFIDDIPRALSAAMDQRLMALRAELAVVIKHQLSRGLSNPGLRELRETATAGSGKVDTNHSTPKAD